MSIAVLITISDDGDVEVGKIPFGMFKNMDEAEDVEKALRKARGLLKAREKKINSKFMSDGGYRDPDLKEADDGRV